MNKVRNLKCCILVQAAAVCGCPRKISGETDFMPEVAAEQAEHAGSEATTSKEFGDMEKLR